MQELRTTSAMDRSVNLIALLTAPGGRRREPCVNMFSYEALFNGMYVHVGATNFLAHSQLQISAQQPHS